jgi:hypothetical protein
MEAHPWEQGVPVVLFESTCLLRILRRDRPAAVTSAALVLGVLCLIVIYAGAGLFADRSSIAAVVVREIDLSEDRSMGEIVNYGLAFLAATLFFLTFVALRSPMFLFASLLMAFIWFDDAAGYHERVGDMLASTLDLPSVAGLRPQDLGEVMAWSAAGVCLGLLLIWSIVHRSPGDMGALALLSLCFGALVCFGIVLDLVHVVAPAEFDARLGIIEDGGEMLAVAMIAGMSLGLSRNAEAYRAASAGTSAPRQIASGPVRRSGARQPPAVRPTPREQQDREVADP